MGATTIKQLEIRPETTWAELDTATGIPAAASGLTGWETVEFIDAAQVTVLGETKQDPGSAARAGFYQNPPEPLIGTPPEYESPKSGSMTLDFYLRPSGGGAINVGLRRLFGTRMALTDANSPSEENISSYTSSSTGSTLTMGSATALAAGDTVIILPDGGGVVYYAHVMTASGTTVLVTPALPTGLALEYLIKLSTWTVPTAGGDPVYNGTSSPSVTLRATGAGWQSIAYGCTLTALTITGTGDDTRAIHCTATIDLAYVRDDFSATHTPAPATSHHGGAIEHSLGSPLSAGADISAAAMLTADDAGDAIDTRLPGACVDEWTLTMTWTTDQLTCGSYYIGRGPLEASALELTLTTTLARAAAGVNSTVSLIGEVKGQWEAAALRTLVLGFDAPAEDGQANRGSGGCIMLTAAGIQDGSFLTVDEGKGFQRVAVTWTMGPYGRHSAADNNSFILALN